MYKRQEIDGSYGSGGGQVIRTALALSILTGKGFYIKNIRAKRKNPGLAPQHLTCVNTAAQICNAKVKGNLLGSKELFFLPKNIEFRNMEINIGTAGSISLLLQALMPSFVNIKRDIELHITGGTDVKMAPSIDYINNVLLKLLSKLGYKASLEIVKRGFYPRGGGKIIFKAEPMSLIKYEFTRRGMCKSVCGISIASKELKKRQVSERQAKKVKATLREKLREFEKIPIEIKLSYVESLNSGSSITLWCETDYSIIGADSIGERNKSSEEVAQEAALSLSLIHI